MTKRSPTLSLDFKFVSDTGRVVRNRPVSSHVRICAVGDDGTKYYYTEHPQKGIVLDPHQGPHQIMVRGQQDELNARSWLGVWSGYENMKGGAQFYVTAESVQ